jgi:hypothetical protein
MVNRSLLAVLFSMLAGAIIWAIHFTIFYGFTTIACARGAGNGAVPYVVALTIGIACLEAAVAVLALREYGLKPAAGDQASLMAFVGWITAAVAGMALMLMILEGLAILFVPACV